MAVEDIDRGWNNIVKQMKLAEGAFTKVGLPENLKVKSTSRKGSGRKKITEAATLIKIAAWNEFGTKHIPPRPAIKQAFDTNKRKLDSFIVKLTQNIFLGKLSAKRAIGLLGEFHVSNTKRQITKLKSPPNKPATVKVKGSSNPLIDRGQYRNSITHEDSL